MGYVPKFRVTPHLIKIIEEISAFRQKILSSTLQVPWMSLLQKEARARTTHSSTAIEGNPLTLEAVRAIEEGRPVPEAGERARREILNHLAGLRFVEKNQGKKTITRTDLLHLHKIIASGVMDQGKAGEEVYLYPRPDYECRGIAWTSCILRNGISNTLLGA